MERNIDLERKILFKIVEVYKPGAGSIWDADLTIEGYDLSTIAEHCDLLDQQGLVKHYEPHYGNDEIMAFRVGNLTALGYDYLELIRNNEIWEKTHTEIEERKLPKTWEMISKIAGTFVGNVIKELNG